MTHEDLVKVLEALRNRPDLAALVGEQPALAKAALAMINISGAPAPQSLAPAYAATAVAVSTVNRESTLTVEELFSEYREWAEPRIKSWHNSQRCHWIHLIKFFGRRTIAELTYDLADEYQQRRLQERRLVPNGKGGTKPGRGFVMPGTINLELNSMRACLNWAVKRRKIATNPLTGHPDLPVEKRRRFVCSEDDFRRILEHCPPTLRLMLVLAYETGMRRNEFRRLEWVEVHLHEDPPTIKLPPHKTKTKRARTITLGKLAVEILRGVPRLTGSRYVFPNPLRATGEPIPKSTLYQQFVKARELAKVKGPNDEEIWIHTLRKSHGVNMALAGMPIYTLMDRLGHTTLDAHAEYTQVSEAHIRASLQYLDRERKGPQGTSPEEAPVLKFLKSGNSDDV